jgi:ComF family protein
MRFEQCLCMYCSEDLPRTRFHDDPMNSVEQLFRGKVELVAASAFLVFNNGGMVQRMLHRLKYHHDMQLGLFMGRLMAEDVMSCTRFADVDCFLPVPLHPRKQHMRGYNQSQILVNGMCQRWNLPAVGKDLMRVVRTPTQTKRNRLDRWLNVKEAFHLPDPAKLSGKHVLIVDDVVTTGATLEGCIKALSVVPDIRISLYTAACA